MKSISMNISDENDYDYDYDYVDNNNDDDEQNISPLCDAYYQDAVNCLLEATLHIHESIRTKAV